MDKNPLSLKEDRDSILAMFKFSFSPLWGERMEPGTFLWSSAYSKINQNSCIRSSIPIDSIQLLLLLLCPSCLGQSLFWFRWKSWNFYESLSSSACPNGPCLADIDRRDWFFSKKKKKKEREKKNISPSYHLSPCHLQSLTKNQNFFVLKSLSSSRLTRWPE